MVTMILGINAGAVVGIVIAVAPVTTIVRRTGKK